MSEELVTFEQPEDLVPYDGDDSDGVPLSIETIELIQNTSRAEGGIPGQFRSKQTGGHVTEIVAAPISIRTKRVLFPKGEFGAQPLCRSDDGIVPAANVIDKKSHECAPCPYGNSMWKAYIAAKKRGVKGQALRDLKPECDEKLEFTYVDRVNFKISRINIGGVSVSDMKKAVKGIANEIRSFRMMLEYKTKRGETVTELPLGMDSFIIKLKGVKVIGQDGAFYTLRTEVGRAENEETLIFRPMYNQLRRELDAIARSYRGQSDVIEANSTVASNLSNSQAPTNIEYVSFPDVHIEP